MLGVVMPTTVSQAQPPQPPIPVGNVSVVVEGGKLAIYVTAFDGPNRRRIAQVEMNKAPLLLSNYVSLSPDGRQVVYVTMDNPFSRANTVVWTAQTDGTGTKAIAQFPEGFWLVTPVWSPDSQQLAYVKEGVTADPEQRLQLWTMNQDGGEQTKILQGGILRPALFASSSHAVSWSPDGRRLQLNDQTTSPPMRLSIDRTTMAITREVTAKEKVFSLQMPASAEALPCSVQLWHQNDYGDNMRTCNLSFATVGCAVTSAAMVFEYYGVNTDPPALNQCLGDSACPLYWGTAASRCSENKVTYVGSSGFSYGTIDQDLAAGRPVIVYLTRWSNTHVVVVTGGGGQTPGGYTINDPYHYSPLRLTLADYTDNGWTLSGLRRYSGTPSCSDPDGGGISYGQTKNGTISPAGDYDDFYFNASAGDAIEIRQNKNGSTLDSFVVLYDPNGNFVAQDDDSGGSLNSFLSLTLASGGRYRIRATGYGSSTGAYTLSLTKVTPNCDSEGDPRWIAYGQTLSGSICPNNDQDTYYFNGTTGRTISIHMNKASDTLDPFLELWSPSNVRLTYNDDGGGNLNAWIVHPALPSSGTYRIVARSYANASSGPYSIKLDAITGGNLALGKPVWVSSIEGPGLEGWRATDGNMGTRWSSQFSDPQQIFVDLGQNRTFNQVVLRWETAYGKRFGIYYWTGSQWQNVYWTDDGRGGTNTINFSPVTARYVSMYGIERGTRWGYSLWEFEVYDTSTTTVPDVPPDDPGKVDTGSVAPLPPTESGKDVLFDGNGELGQEETPLAGTDPVSVSGQMNVTQTVVAFIQSPDPDGLYKLYTPAGYVRFESLASSQVGTSTIAITGYNWRSDRNGNIGSQSLFTLPVTSLMPGEHTIYLKAQNALGTWSEEVTTTLTVEWPYQVYLPTITK
jgi:uncharacterized protein YvpB